MSFLQFLFILAIIWAIRNIVLGVLAWLDRRKIEQVIRVEHTRSRFAEARNDLMWLVVRGQLSPHSATFRTLYYFNTHVLRRPDEYTELSGTLRRLFLARVISGQENPLPEESKTWSPEVREAMVKTGLALNTILVSHSPAFRLAYKFKWLLSPSLKFLEKAALQLLKYVEAHERKDPVIADIRATQYMLNELASSHR